MIVSAERVIRALVNHFHQTDGEATTVTAVGHQLFEVLDQDACEAGVAHTPLTMDYAALLVNLLTIERQVVTPVVKDKQARVDSSLARGYIIYIIHCFLDAGVSVELSSELHADAFQIFNQRAVGEVSCAIEAHMLQEVSETALALLFLNRTHFLCDIEEGLVLRLFVVTDVIGQTVVEVTYAHFLIYRKRLHQLAHILGLSCKSAHCEGCHQKNLS